MEIVNLDAQVKLARKERPRHEGVHHELLRSLHVSYVPVTYQPQKSRAYHLAQRVKGHRMRRLAERAVAVDQVEAAVRKGALAVVVEEGHVSDPEM